MAHVLPSQLDLERKLSLVESKCREKDKNILALTSQIEEQVGMLRNVYYSTGTWNPLWLLSCLVKLAGLSGIEHRLLLSLSFVCKTFF